ncbi:Ger(x)C family spore germination protein [Paenibacillus tepidiphilus]|uniref:Ger(x)C family spore germination protein n=1 Tax=Paenibacillus tepidiphilus TaxID=2608683 RepID=UPI001238AA19|nr:Ger(x)C family spore germination protein [Paenibacillus tepidiphilus]
MNRRTAARLLLAMLLPLVLGGCWERRELNEMAFVLGMGIDKAEAGYRVSLQVVIPSAISSQVAGGAGSGGVPVVEYAFTVPTIYETLRKFNLVSSRSAYLGHIRVLVFGEELAREGLGETLDVLKRSRESRMDFYVMVARNTSAENVLKVLTPLDKIPASKLFNALDKSYRISAKTVAVSLDEFIEDLLAEGNNPVLTGVELSGEADKGEKKGNVEQTTPEVRLRYESVAVFRKDRMLGWLKDQETVGYNYLTNKVVKNSGSVAGEDGKPIVVESLQTSTKRKVRMIGGEPHIFIDATLTSNIQEVFSTDNLEAERQIEKIERKAEEVLVTKMKNAYEGITQRFNTDIFGFGQIIYQKSPKAWYRLQQKHGDDYLRSLPVHYKAKVTINRIGTIDRTILDEIKE